MKSKSETKPWEGAQPYILGAANQLQDVYNQNNPALQNMSQDLQGRIPGLMDRAQNDSPSLAAGRAYATDVLGGKYLNGNAQLENMIQMSRGNVMDDVNTRAALRGRTGGDRHAYNLGRGLSDSELGLRYANYGDEMGRMERAAGMTPGFDAAQNANLNTALGASSLAANMPYIGANNLASGIGGLLGGYTQTTQRQPIGPALLQAGGNIAAAFAGSDERLKTNIVNVGQESDGLEVYEFDYIDDLPAEIAEYCPKGRQRGVMASQVAKLRPWALGPVVGGYATVDYGAL
jgi:hypothetical protein